MNVTLAVEFTIVPLTPSVRIPLDPIRALAKLVSLVVAKYAQVGKFLARKSFRRIDQNLRSTFIHETDHTIDWDSGGSLGKERQWLRRELKKHGLLVKTRLPRTLPEIYKILNKR